MWGCWCACGRKNWCAGACAAHYQNVCDVRVGAAENPRTLKVCRNIRIFPLLTKVWYISNRSTKESFWCLINFITEELEAKQEEPAPKKLKLDIESEISEPSEEPAKDLDENDGANLEKSPEVFDDDEIEPLVIDDNSELGIIHKLRKHLYSTKLNLTSKCLKLPF